MPYAVESRTAWEEGHETFLVAVEEGRWLGERKQHLPGRKCWEEGLEEVVVALCCLALLENEREDSGALPRQRTQLEPESED